MAKGNPPPLNDDPDLMDTPKSDNDQIIVSKKSVANAGIPGASVGIPGATTVATTASVTTNSTPAPVMLEVNNNTTVAQNNQSNSSVGLAQVAIDDKIVTHQITKEEEPWVKAYWRPAMGWLYMIICFMDFVGFPLLTIFLPLIFKPFGFTVPYQTWTSLTLSNGGLIHLAFGAILGVSAFTRGQEKTAMANNQPPR